MCEMHDIQNGKTGIECERVTVRRFNAGDAEGFAALIRDKMTSEYREYDDAFPTDDASLGGILAYFTDSDEFFAVVLRETGALIGFVSLNRVEGDTRNLGYCIHSAYRGKGYAGEAVDGIICFAEDILGVRKLVCGTAEKNIPSVKLLTRRGFTETGRGEGSFMNDENGNPIVFTGISFEKVIGE